MGGRRDQNTEKIDMKNEMKTGSIILFFYTNDRS